jgi:glutathione S-transferase
VPVLYDSRTSGNAYKARLLLAHLGIVYRRVELDFLRGETRTPEFLAKNPQGLVPVLELDDGTCIPESNAILWFLGEGTPFVPESKIERARMLQWMFFEQHRHELSLGMANYVAVLLPSGHPLKADLARYQEKSTKVLKVMETHLAGAPFFSGASYSIADIALFPYTRVAEDAGIALSPYPHVRVWLDRVAAQPGHIPFTQTEPDSN